ncbi:TenA family protein [Lichenicoccus sp.]|uniref:TenA family protein n=1 Tax=Lichenicoccus sp. TaxID=2781899 RepID=UPI003D151B47
MPPAAAEHLTGLPRGTLFERLRRDCTREWHDYTHHSFVSGLAAGTLPEASFRTYLVQDYLYLIQYARAYALAVYKDPEVAGMRATARLLADLLDTELGLHIAYCRDWGLSEADLARQPESLELLAYTRFMLDCGQRGDILDLLVSLSACLVGYAEIGLRLLADPGTRRDGNRYLPWIEVYGGAHYVQLAAEGIVRLDALALSHGADARYAMLLRSFRTTVRLEAAFWTPSCEPAS